MRIRVRPVVLVAVLALTVAGAIPGLHAQGAPAPPAAAPGRSAGPVPDPTKPAKLTMATGSKARYRVREQLAGISFPSDAVGTTESLTGSLVVNPNGTLDAARSKISIDLRTLTSDQQMRDGYVKDRTLETSKFPTMDFVPKRVVGLTGPLPSAGQAGFQLIGDVTLHGVTAEVTWNVIATFSNDGVAGSARASVNFAMFGLTKPSLARLLSVDDKIELELEFRTQRSAL